MANLKAAADSGKNPTTAINLAPSTPSSRASAASKATPGSRATPKSTSRKKSLSTPLKREFSDEDDEESEEVDYKARDLTPTPTVRPLKKQKPTPAQPSAAVTAVAAVDLTSEDDDAVPTPAPANESFPITGSETSDSKETTQPHSFYGTESFQSGYSLESTLLGPEEVDQFNQELSQMNPDMYAHNMYGDPEISFWVDTMAHVKGREPYSRPLVL